jgi:hypothetical protein
MDFPSLSTNTARGFAFQRLFQNYPDGNPWWSMTEIRVLSASVLGIKIGRETAIEIACCCSDVN